MVRITRTLTPTRTRKDCRYSYLGIVSDRIGCLRPQVAISRVFYCLNKVNIYTGTETAKRYVETNTAKEGEDEGEPEASPWTAGTRGVSACRAVSAGLGGCHVGRKHLGARTSRRRVRAAGHHPSAIPTPNHPEPT